MVSGYDGKGCLIVLNTLQLELVADLNDVRDSYGGPHTSKKNGIGVQRALQMKLLELVMMALLLVWLSNYNSRER